MRGAVTTMKKKEFLAAVQSRVARIAVGPSTVRGKGHAGAVAAAQAFFREVDLADFGVSPPAFRKALDRATRALVRRLPKGARHWGIARKLLNIFLRDSLYTTYLDTEYCLSRAVEALEIPLDSITGKQLNRIAGRGGLPRWPGVKNLSPSVSRDGNRS